MSSDLYFWKRVISVQSHAYSGVRSRRARWIKLLTSICAITLMAACGGGGSSSSGSGGGNNQFAGTYSGSHTVNYLGGGVNSSAVVFLTMTVNPNGSFRIVDGVNDPNSIPVTGTLDGNRFSASGSGSGTLDGITCDVTIAYSGSIQNDTATGSDRGSGNCRSGGRSVTLSINGQFELPKGSNARAPRNSTLIEGAATLLQ